MNATYVLDQDIEPNLQNLYYSNLHRYYKAQLVPLIGVIYQQNSFKPSSISKYGQ